MTESDLDRAAPHPVSEIVHPDEDLPGLLARLLDELPVGIILYDVRADFRITYANPVMEECTAPEVRPLVGRTLREMFPTQYVDAVVDALSDVARSGVSQNWRNFRFRRAGGPGEPDHTSYWDWNAIPLRSPDGVVTHVMGVAVNETSQELVRERLQVSLDLALDLTSSLDAGQVVDRLLERALTALRADRATLVRIEKDEVEIAGALDLGEPAPARGTRFPISVPRFRDMLRDRKPLVELFDTSGLPDDVQTSLSQVRHAATVPLVVEGEVFAALSVSRRRDEPFTAADMLTMQQIGAVSILAVRNALLFAEAEAAREHSERVARRLGIGVDLALDLAEQPTPSAVVRQILRRAIDALSADRVTLASVAGGQILIEDSLAVEAAAPLPIGSRWPIAEQPLVEMAIRSRHATRGHNDDPAVRVAESDLWNLEHVVMVPLVLQGEVTAVLGASRLTEPAFSDEEIATLQQIGSIAVLAVRNARLLQEAQEASRAKSDFLNLAAHELRTPLSVISGYLSMLQDGSFGTPSDLWRAPIDTVSAKAAELSDLVRSLLTAARIQSGTLPTTRQVLDLRHLVLDACTRARPRAEMLGGDVTFELPEYAVNVAVDDDQVGRILDNLINNGLTYSQSPAAVHVELGGEGSADVLVRDRGIGIEESQQARVFERFFRAESAVTMTSGTGLGLYIARELAAGHGGSLELVDSRPGQGSTFMLRLPLAAEAPLPGAPGAVGL